MRLRFLRTILLLTITLALVLYYPLYAWSSSEIIHAVLASGIVAFANIVLGYLTLEYGIDKSNQVFMISVFGGMGVRMGLILIAFTVLLLSGFHQSALTLSLMGFYVVFMVAEIIHVTRAMGKRKAEAYSTARTRSVAPARL